MYVCLLRYVRRPCKYIQSYMLWAKWDKVKLICLINRCEAMTHEHKVRGALVWVGGVLELQTCCGDCWRLWLLVKDPPPHGTSVDEKRGSALMAWWPWPPTLCFPHAEGLPQSNVLHRADCRCVNPGYHPEVAGGTPAPTRRSPGQS